MTTGFSMESKAQASCKLLFQTRFSTQKESETLRREMNRVISNSIKKGDFHNILFEVSDFHGKNLFRFTNGNFSPFTAMPVLSASKWISTAAILRLVELRILNLDHKVGRYLTARDGSPLKKQLASMTLRQLLSFTSGLTGEQTSFLRTDLSLEDAVHELFEATSPQLKSGIFNYNDNHLQVASLMAIKAVKKRTGVEKTFSQIVQENIGDPLGISQIEYFSKPRKREGAQNPRAAAGLRVSFKDYQKFLLMLAQKGVYEGRQVLKAETLREMEKNQVDVPDQEGKSYGFGNWRIAAENMSPGFGGWFPVINRKAGFTALLGALEVGETTLKSEALYNELRPLIEELVSITDTVSDIEKK
jgi:CubicO group peptidase (beta-lactamase class C family)